MNILVLTNYQLYQDLSFSFVHAQVRAFVEQGHQVRVLIYTAIGRRIYSGEQILLPLKKKVDGAELVFLPYLSLSNFGENGFNDKSALFFLRLFEKLVVDDFPAMVVHAHTLGAACNLGAFLKKRFHCPLVVTTHGSDSSIPLEQGKYDQMKALCKDADHIVAVSSVLGGKLRKCGTTTPISTILNGFAVQHLPADIKKQPLSFIQVGQLSKQKRVDITIRAFAKIHTAHPSATLTIIGQGAERTALETLCAELNITRSVRFLGQIPNHEVLAEMATAQFFAMPSVREGFGIVYLEAMANGCITIGTEGEGISDLIVHGENGFLVPADDPDAIVNAVESCLQNSEQAKHIAHQGSSSAKELTWSANAKKYIELFEQLIRRS